MNIYTNRILPRLMDWTMSGEPFQSYRRQLLATAQGRVLEIGFGTGLNVTFYPSTVETLTTIDVNPGMGSLAQPRLKAAPFPVDVRILNGEVLPFADASFDCVVSTWTLCSIQRVEQALGEIQRVLAPKGVFLFIEHGRSPESGVSAWQDRLTPIQRVLADGCHLNRPIQALVEEHFTRLTLDRFYAPTLPKTLGYMYRGKAEKH